MNGRLEIVSVGVSISCATQRKYVDYSPIGPGVSGVEDLWA